MSSNPDVYQLVSEIKRQWSNGENADAILALSTYPELNDIRPLVLDLAYEEYCIRLESGDDMDIKSFCSKFPQCQSSLHRRIENTSVDV